MMGNKKPYPSLRMSKGVATLNAEAMRKFNRGEKTEYVEVYRSYSGELMLRPIELRGKIYKVFNRPRGGGIGALISMQSKDWNIGERDRFRLFYVGGREWGMEKIGEDE